MGTRSLTVLKDDEDVEIAVMYRQYDGYPDGHGQQLAEFIRNADHNGMDCLAAQIVAHFKTESGYTYTLQAQGIAVRSGYIQYIGRLGLTKCS